MKAHRSRESIPAQQSVLRVLLVPLMIVSDALEEQHTDPTWLPAPGVMVGLLSTSNALISCELLDDMYTHRQGISTALAHQRSTSRIRHSPPPISPLSQIHQRLVRSGSSCQARVLGTCSCNTWTIWTSCCLLQLVLSFWCEHWHEGTAMGALRWLVICYVDSRGNEHVDFAALNIDYVPPR